MKVSDISKRRLDELNRGASETKNLTEWLAIDQKKLLVNLSKVFAEPEFKALSKRLPQATAPRQIAWIGQELKSFKDLSALQKADSDMVRCWACYAQSAKSKSLKSALAKVKPYARDEHFGVREIAWLSVRQKICDSPHAAIELLLPWAKSQDCNLRRFASEATRPRGVWAKHIGDFKRDPRPGEPLLSLLHKDESRYVQDSVANWLNDAAKDHPDWVLKLTAAWVKASPEKPTLYIVKRATRSIK